MNKKISELTQVDTVNNNDFTIVNQNGITNKTAISNVRTISEETPSTLSGILKADGTSITTALEGIDYVTLSSLSDNIKNNVINPLDIITSGPWIDVRTFMDGINGRPTVAQWQSAQSTTDLTSAIEAANTYIGTTGGTLKFPVGTFVASYIKLRSKVVYEGMGESTILQLKSGTNTDFITLNTVDVNHWRMTNLTIDGNAANNTSGSAINLYRGIGVNTEGGYNDPWFTLDNLWIMNGQFAGINIGGAGASGGNNYNIRAGRISKVTISNCANYGIYASLLSDSTLTEVVVYNSGKQNIYFTSCDSFHMAQVKTYYSGTLDATLGGMTFMTCSRFSLTSCEAQEEYGNGFYLNTCTDFNMNGCIADANGRISSDYPGFVPAYGYYFYICTGFSFQGVATSYHTPSWQAYGVNFYACNKGSVNLTWDNQVNGGAHIGGTSYSIQWIENGAHRIVDFPLFLGGIKMTMAASIPTAGTWSVGDRCLNSNPVVGQPKGWICTAAGTPGTWTSEGNL